MSQRRTLSFLMSLLSAAVVAGLAAVSTAQADTIHVEPDRIASRTAAFELGGIDSARIVSAELLTSRGTKAVPVATVRRATAGDDRLRVRPPRAWRVSKRYDKRLVLRIVTRSSRRVHRFRPEATTRRSATFFVRPLREETITSVELVGDDARREVPVQRVASGTRGGNVRVTLPRAWDRQDRKDTELHVVVDQPPASPPPSSSGDGCDYDLREAGGPDRPPACWRPYADSSPFNRPIPASPPLMADSAAMVETLTGFGRMQKLEAGNGGGRSDFNRPVYFSRADDPVFTITCTRTDWGRCPVEGRQVRMPDEARPAGHSDAHLAVIDPQTGIEVDLWQVQDKPSGGGKLVVSWGDRLSVHGDGVGSTATGAGVAVHAGLIRAEELAAGRIDHALAMAIDCTNGSHVYPAIKVDSECDSGTAPPMGARLQLDLSEAEVDALDVPGWKTTILHALRRYGAYVIDSGGTSAILMESEQGHSAFGEANPLVDFFKANGADFWDPTRRWTLDLDSDVDWERDLQVLDPCVAQGSCG